eukprot:GEMP01039185.1.p1 GENE.GEMP01039185.1~~GEMP01039185.1.p1  ORF type:complete len:363 (+),score=67.00 GEMP01039185.1:25-1089(+)
MEKEECFDSFCQDWSGDTCLPSMSSADYYFHSYNHYHVYEELLKDAISMTAYRNAILRNKHLFENKVVLDVDCGLGVLSMLAAKAGAKQVIGIDPQEELIKRARPIARDNGYGDVVTFIHGRVDTAELPVEHVDIIVSLCVGYFLLYEGRFADVLTAKKRWLRPNGLIFPDRFRLFIDLLKDSKYRKAHFDFCNNVWNFNFSSLKESSVGEAVIQCWNAEADGNNDYILSNSPWLIYEIDLNHCTIEDVQRIKTAKWRLRARTKGAAHGLIGWFEVLFTKCHTPVAFSTSPRGTYTCWQHIGMFFKNPIKLKEGDMVEGMLAARTIPGKRHLEIKVSHCAERKKEWVTQFFQLQ